MNNKSPSGLIASALLAAAATAMSSSIYGKVGGSPVKPRRSTEKQMRDLKLKVEQAKWNAEVDRKRAARKGRK